MEQLFPFKLFVLDCELAFLVSFLGSKKQFNVLFENA